MQGASSYMLLVSTVYTLRPRPMIATYYPRYKVRGSVDIEAQQPERF